jgi:hypothetical protein
MEDEVLQNDGAGALSWVTNTAGDVVGPDTSTSRAISTWSDTSGELLADSGVLITNSNDIQISAGRILYSDKLEAITVSTRNLSSSSYSIHYGSSNGISWCCARHNLGEYHRGYICRRWCV